MHNSFMLLFIFEINQFQNNLKEKVPIFDPFWTTFFEFFSTLLTEIWPQWPLSLLYRDPLLMNSESFWTQSCLNSAPLPRITSPNGRRHLRPSWTPIWSKKWTIWHKKVQKNQHFGKKVQKSWQKVCKKSRKNWNVDSKCIVMTDTTRGFRSPVSPQFRFLSQNVD